MQDHALSQPPLGAPGPRHWPALRGLQPAWYYASLLFLAMTLVFWSAQWLDARTLLGVSVWTKPFKFSLSLFAYFATLLLMAQLVPATFWRTLSGRSLVSITLVMALGEMAYIIWQAAQGEASHFNHSTSFHSMMYSLMGFGAVMLVSVLVWFALVIARAARWQLLSQPMTLAVTVGLALTFLLGGGFGGYLGGNGSHFVGPGTTDADGLWLVKWARDVGDLRVAHFFGMHAMQVIPLFALMLPSRWPTHVQASLIIAAATAYAALTTATFVQALHGQPFLGGL